MKKGDVLGVARIAGIMGAKRTAELIPLCHILNLTKASLDFELMPADRDARPGIRALCTVRCSGKTGVEMEALTGVSVALLTIYDMCNGTGPPCQKIGRKIRTFRKSAACDKIYINRTAIGHNVQNSEMTAREFSGRQESAALPIPASAALSVCFSWRECRPEFHRPAEV